MKKTLKGVKEILMCMCGEEFVGNANKSLEKEIEYAKSVSFDGINVILSLALYKY